MRLLESSSSLAVRGIVMELCRIDQRRSREEDERWCHRARYRVRFRNAVFRAVGVGRSLARRFPHLTNQNIAGPFGEFDAIIDALRAADLILSLSGNWPAESLRDAVWLGDNTLPSVVYGWAEPHASVGHAVVLQHGQGCLRCILDDLGKMQVPVTRWPATTLLQTPACGELFEPYGVTELAHVQALHRGTCA